jgi:predicted amidophosphoribosyltransferase
VPTAETARLPIPGCYALEYDETARRFLLRAKFGRRRELFAPMGRMLAAAVRRASIEATCLVPVPSHPRITLARGFSPAGELARQLGSGLGVRVRPMIRRRWLGGSSIKRLSRRDRFRYASGLFRIHGSLAGEDVLLVDDLATSGATLRACADLCRKRGAAQVLAAVWARNPSRR